MIEIIDHSWKDRPAILIDNIATDVLLKLYSVLMATSNANDCYIRILNKDKQQYFSPDLNSTLEIYFDLLKAGAIKVSERYWQEQLAIEEDADLARFDFKNGVFEINFESQLSNYDACIVVQNEITERINKGQNIPIAAIQCWYLLNYAYCINAIQYRQQTFGMNAYIRDFTTAEYIDLKSLTSQLSAGWIHTLCHRAFTWVAGKQREARLTNTKTASLAISAVIRQFTWATESEPKGNIYTRPNSLVIFGIERMFKDLFGIAPAILYGLKPDIRFLQEAVLTKYTL